MTSNELDKDTIIDIVENMPEVASQDMIVNLLINILAVYDMDNLDIAPQVVAEILCIIDSAKNSKDMNPNLLH